MIWQKLVELDKWLNGKLGGNPDETISYRLGYHIRKRNCWPCRIFCRTVLLPLGILLDKSWKHCVETYEHNKERDNG